MTNSDLEFEGSPPKRANALLLRARCRCRVVETPTDAHRVAGEHWAHLAGAVAECNDVIKLLSRELIDMFRALAADVDVKLIAKHVHAERVNFQRLCTRAVHVDRARAQVPQDSFGHLRASRVMSAKEEHAFSGLHHDHSSLSLASDRPDRTQSGESHVPIFESRPKVPSAPSDLRHDPLLRDDVTSETTAPRFPVDGCAKMLTDLLVGRSSPQQTP